MPDLTAGAQEFGDLAGRLRNAGEGSLRREVARNITAATGPVLAQIRGGLPDRMPDRYAAVLAADLKLRTLKEDVPGRAGVRVIADARTARGGRRKLPLLDRGVLGHPLFGFHVPGSRRWTAWFDQTDGVTPGFFTGPLGRSAPQMRDAILTAMRQTAAKITRG